MGAGLLAGVLLGGESVGTGIVVGADGLVLTNQHVVARERGRPDPPPRSDADPVGAANDLRPGQRVVAIGFALALEDVGFAVPAEDAAGLIARFEAD